MAKPAQRVVVKIGYMEIMLPDDTNAATVVKTLSKGVEVRHYGGREVRIEKPEVTVSLSYLPSNTIFQDERGEEIPMSPPKGGKRALKALPAPGLLQLMEGRDR